MLLMQSALLLVFVTTTLGQKDLVIDCEGDTVTVKWRPESKAALKVDRSKAHLGTCSPSSLTENDVLQFSVWLQDCGFRRWVNEERVTYTNWLIYELSTELPPIVERVQCSYDTSGQMTKLEGMRTNLGFRMDFMKSDFSGPATSTMFTLGSRISIRAKGEHMLMQIYLQSCMLAKTADLADASQLHTLLSNGCLTESKEGNATFLPRLTPSEIRFYFQASEFALKEPLFLHCDMAAWDHQSFSSDRKACYYLHDRKRWQLLDDPAQSYLCSCCDTGCSQETSLESGISVRKVLGPFMVIDSSEHGLSDEHASWQDDQDLGGVPVWVIVLTVFLVLVLLTGAIGGGYYMCIWRGGRVGYRPRRDLLNKY